MKKVKSFAKHPAIIIPVIMYVLYFGWNLVAAAGLEKLAHAVLLGIMAVACTGVLVTWAFCGLKEAQGRWEKKQIVSAVVAVILPVISIVVLGAAAVIPLVCGVEMFALSAELIISAVMIVLLFDLIVEALPLLLRP